MHVRRLSVMFPALLVLLAGCTTAPGPGIFAAVENLSVEPMNVDRDAVVLQRASGEVLSREPGDAVTVGGRHVGLAPFPFVAR